MGKITVFIGEQASGKSVLAKLIATLREKAFYSDSAISQTLKEFNIHQYLNKKTTILFSNDIFEIKFENNIFKRNSLKLENANLEDKLRSVEELLVLINGYKAALALVNNEEDKTFIEENLNRYNLILTNSIYIPAERILISLISESLFGFITSNISLPKFLLNFGNEYEKGRKEVKAFHAENLDIKYVYENQNDKITYK